MQVISTGQSIQLANFPDLNAVSKYGETNSTGSYDFQFLRQSPLFITSNPEKPIEYLTKRTKHEHEEILFVRRIRTDIANTVACPNFYGFDIAVGTTTGYIQMHHYKTMEETVKFNPPTINDAVMVMSFNCQDDQLASLHESGVVQLFGLKTSVRTDLITFDKEVTHIRFHPKRKLHLGMVSYNGHIHVYDTQAKKKVFTHMAHQAPCRDLAMSPVNDNCLVTVGYDHLINLFDTRTKIASIQLSTPHPLSAVAVSPCGSYCCVGNLKGQLLAYDFRHLKEPLIQTKNNHSSFVKRVEFLPTTEEVSLTEKFPGDAANRPLGRRDSMQHFFDHHYKRLPEQRKLSNLFSAENTSGTRISLGHDFKRLLREEETVRSREHSLSSSSSSDVEFVGFVAGPKPKIETTAAEDEGETKGVCEPKTPLVSIMSISHMAEEGAQFGNERKELIPKRLTNSRLSNRMDPVIPENEEFIKVSQRPVRKSIQTSTPLNSAALVSTPTSTTSSGKKLMIPGHYLGHGDSLEHKINSPAVLAAAAATSVAEKLVENERSSQQATAAVSPAFEQQLNERIERLEKQLEFRLEQNSWELKNYNTLVYVKQMEAVEELQRSVMDLTVGMNCLIRSDDFMDEFFRLRQENEELKARLMGNGGH